MKLKQKSYLLTVLLVSGVLYVCILFLSLPNLTASLAAVKTRALGEEKALAQAMDGLFLQIRPDDREKSAAIFADLGTEQASFSVGKGDRVWVEATPPIGDVGAGRAAWVVQNGRYMLVISDRLTGDIWLRYRLDGTDVIRRAERRTVGAILLCAALCGGMAAAMYVLLLRINRPIDRLAHELRTPLTVIRGYGELLERARLTPEQQHAAASYIVAESERLGEISQKLLTMSDAREQAYKPERVALSELFAHLQQTYPTLTVESDWDRLTCDRALMLSMLSNLIGNAVKASAPGSPVSLIAKPGEIRIVDRGRGMTAEQLAYVNDPAHAKNPSVRSGLGVPLCHEIAALHRASLRFASEEGRGTTATVHFTTL